MELVSILQFHRLPRSRIHFQPCRCRPLSDHLPRTHSGISIAFRSRLNDRALAEVRFNSRHSFFDAVDPQSQGPQRSFALSTFECIRVNAMAQCPAFSVEFGAADEFVNAPFPLLARFLTALCKSKSRYGRGRPGKTLAWSPFIEGQVPIPEQTHHG